MGVVTSEMELATAVPPAKFFKALADGPHKIFTKIMPQAIKSVEFIEGDGEVGSIRQVNMGDGYPSKSAREKIDKLDKENLVYGYSLIGGDILDGKLEKICNEIKVAASPDGGSIVKCCVTFHALEGVDIQENIKAAEERFLGLVKSFEGYLLANP